MSWWIRKGRTRGVKLGALVSAFLFVTSALVSAFAQEPADYLKDALVPEGTLPPTPELAPPIETIKINVTVPAGSPSVSRSETLLRGGSTYRLVIKGTWVWFRPNNFADGECAQWQALGGSSDPTWLRNRFAGEWASMVTRGPNTSIANTTSDPLDIYVDGAPVEWTPLVDTGGGCNTQDHTYYVDYAPSTDRRVSFNAYDPFNAHTQACVQTPSGSCVAAGDRFVVSIHKGPAPEARPGDQLVDTVLVDPRNPKRPPEVRSNVDLEKGQAYRFVASGTYSVADFPGYLGDAECGITDAPGDRWEAERFNDRTRFPSLYTGIDTGDVFVNGEFVTWVPLWETSPKCNAFDHKYSYLFAPNVSGKVRFLLQAVHNANNGGMVKVDIYRAGPPGNAPNVGTGPVTLPTVPQGSGSSPGAPSIPNCDNAKDDAGFAITPCYVQVPAGSTSGISAALRGGTTYRLESSGVYTWHTDPGNFADSECASWLNSPVWGPNLFGALSAGFTTTSWQPTDDPLDLYVDNGQVNWLPKKDTGAGCDMENHAYSADYQVATNRFVNFKVFDSINRNQFASGSLFVSISVGGSEPEAGSDDMLVATVVLTPKYSMTGSTTIQLPKGRLHRIVASGTYRVGDYEIDAECSSRSDAWVPHRWGTSFDLGDVLIDNRQEQWTPLNPGTGGSDAAACNATDHTYRYYLTPTRSAPVTFKLRISDYSLNYEGAVVIRVYAVG